jgi:tRNA pseudouridine55 synthase
MAELVRTESGSIRLDQCLALEQIAAAHADGTLWRHMIPADRAIGHLPAARLPQRLAEQALRGHKIPVSLFVAPSPDEAETELIRLYDTNERFLGIFRLERTPGDGGTAAARRFAVPVKVFS